MRTFNSLLSISVLMLCFLSADVSNAALVLRITNPPPNTDGPGNVVTSISLTNAVPSQSITVGVTLDTVNSGGLMFNSYAFQLRLSNGAIGQFTGVSIPTVPNGGPDIVNSSFSGTTAFAQGTFAPGNRKPINLGNIPGNSGYIDLATFTITGIGTGGGNISIEELTIGNGDFTLATSQDVGATINPQDSTIFPGSSLVIRSLPSTISVNASVTAVPEPSSMLLCAATIVGAGFYRRRRSVQQAALVLAAKKGSGLFSISDIVAAQQSHLETRPDPFFRYDAASSSCRSASVVPLRFHG